MEVRIRWRGGMEGMEGTKGLGKDDCLLMAGRRYCPHKRFVGSKRLHIKRTHIIRVKEKS